MITVKGCQGRRAVLRFVCQGAIGVWGAWQGCCPGLVSAAETQGRQPNIVLILADDLGWSDLACYGNTFHETPNLDRLAREGMRFTDAYAAASICSPTRACLMTGKYPARIGMTHITQYQPRPNPQWREPVNQPFLPLDEITVFEVLKTAGYATAHIGKWHLGEGVEGDPTRQGADINMAGNNQGQPPDYFYPYLHTNANGEVLCLVNPPSGKAGDFLDERLADEAGHYMAQHRDKPFFLLMSHFLPHTSTGDRLQARPELIAKYQRKAGLVEPDIRVTYAAMIEELDRCVGSLLRQLEILGLDKDTMVIFTSDNGGYSKKTSNAPLRGGKRDGYEGGLRVPAFVRWTGHIKSGVVSDVPIVTADLYPTLLDVGGGRPTPGQAIDGVDLMPYLTGGQAIQREDIFWHYPHFDPVAFSAVRSGRWKLIEFFGETGTRHELYDLVNDRAETTDLSGRMPDRVRSLQLKLDQWRQSVGARMPVRISK